VNSYTPDNNHATLTTIAPSGCGRARQKFACIFSKLDGNRLLIACSERPPVSATVSMEFNDALFLGEVVCANPTLEGRWNVEVRVEQILTGLQSLMTLREHLLGEGVGQPVERDSYLGVCA
jgi:hypothetical protein